VQRVVVGGAREQLAGCLLEPVAQVLDVGCDGMWVDGRGGEGVVLQVGGEGGLQETPQRRFDVGRFGGLFSLTDQCGELVGGEGLDQGLGGREVAVDGADADIGALRDGVELDRLAFARQGACGVDDAAAVARGVLAQRGLSCSAAATGCALPCGNSRVRTTCAPPSGSPSARTGPRRSA